jgi:hypothetical protein
VDFSFAAQTSPAACEISGIKVRVFGQSCLRVYAFIALPSHVMSLISRRLMDVAPAFGMWRQRTEIASMVKQSKRSVIGKWLNSTLHAAFGAWANVAVHLASNRAACTSRAGRDRLKLGRNVFEAWRREARFEAHACAKVAARRRAVDRVILGGFFESWNMAAVSASTPGLVLAFQRRRSSRRILTSFAGWRGQVDVKLSACIAAHILSVSRGKDSLEWALGGWKAAVLLTRLAFKLAFRVTVCYRTTYHHALLTTHSLLPLFLILYFSTSIFHSPLLPSLVPSIPNFCALSLIFRPSLASNMMLSHEYMSDRDT